MFTLSLYVFHTSTTLLLFIPEVCLAKKFDSGEKMFKWFRVIFLLCLINLPSASVTTQDSVFSLWQNKAISFTPNVASLTHGSSSVVVAVIDGGIDFHHYDLGTQLEYVNPHPGLDGYKNDVHGWNFYGNNNDIYPIATGIDSNGNGIPDEDLSHATSIAGIIAGQGQDVLGIVPNVKILTVKVFASDGQAASIEKGFDYVYNLSLRDPRIKVINFSGVLDYSGDISINSTLNKLMANGVTIVASAGNDYNIGDYNVSFPANYPGVISVGSINNNLEVSSFSQRGNKLDFVAPGENVFSLAVNNQINNNLDGTSYAAPFYTAAVAFIDSLHYKKPLTQGEIFSILKNSTTDLGSPGWDPTYGYGLLNMTKLVQTLTPLLSKNPSSINFSWIQLVFVFLLITLILKKKTKLKK